MADHLFSRASPAQKAAVAREIVERVQVGEAAFRAWATGPAGVPWVELLGAETGERARVQNLLAVHDRCVEAALAGSGFLLKEVQMMGAVEALDGQRATQRAPLLVPPIVPTPITIPVAGPTGASQTAQAAPRAATPPTRAPRAARAPAASGAPPRAPGETRAWSAAEGAYTAASPGAKPAPVVPPAPPVVPAAPVAPRGLPSAAGDPTFYGPPAAPGGAKGETVPPPGSRLVAAPPFVPGPGQALVTIHARKHETMRFGPAFKAEGWACRDFDAETGVSRFEIVRASDRAEALLKWAAMNGLQVVLTPHGAGATVSASTASAPTPAVGPGRV